MVTPSGEQIELIHARQRAVVVEVGGGVREYAVDGQHLLDGYPPHDMCTGARGQLLMPWPNRVLDGRWSWRGRDYQLDITEAPKFNAIHGLVRWSNWRCAERSPERAVLTHRLHGHPGYPFVLDLSVEYVLDERGLTVRMHAKNVGDHTAPFAAGAHPYLRAGTDTIDPCSLSLPGSRWLPTDDRGIPTGVDDVQDTAYDFRDPRRIGGTQIDNAFCDLVRDGDGLAAVQLRHPGGSPGVELWLDSAFPYLEAFTGDTLPESGARRRGLGLEPMTAPPNALQTGTDLVVLEPGDGWTGAWGLRPLD